MGYSEKLCRLCGVTFNMGRRRLRSEPDWMGWECTGDAKRVGCQLGKDRDPSVCNDDGCSDDEQEEETDYKTSRSADVYQDMIGVEIGEFDAEVQKMLDGDLDDDYQYEDSDKEEFHEFESDDEMSDPEDDDHMDIDSAVEDDTYALFKHAVSSLPEPGTEKTGPHNCFRGIGYKGRFITAEEMRGCNTAQCLISKANHGAEAEEPDDQDFEREIPFCLSGLLGHVCSRDGSDKSFVPARHGVTDAWVDSWGIETRDTAVPFHPACFDIFSRLSRKRFGYINVEALGIWMFDYNNGDDVDHVSSDPNVGLSSQQFWEHLDGCEYLGANPLLIPRLAPILQAAIEKDTNFNPQDGAFPVSGNEGASDVFGSLPLEMRLQTLSYLGSSDIANLRLASRTFRQLPILLWRDLLLKEMPFLWEVWSDELPFIWATVQFEDVVEHEQVEIEIGTWRARTRDIIKANLPEILDAWEQHIDEILLQRDNNFLEKEQADALKKMVPGLPALKTNWYKVYTGITRNWKNLKGLQNRMRIWKDIGVIVEKLDQYTLPA